MSSLHFTAQSGNLELLYEYLAAGHDVNAVDVEGMTPLHHAVQVRRLDCLILLVEAGADVNACNTSGFSPLHGAAEQGSLSKTRYLLEKGADANTRLIQNHNHFQAGFTPKDVAAACGHTNVVRWIEKLVEIL